MMSTLNDVINLWYLQNGTWSLPLPEFRWKKSDEAQESPVADDNLNDKTD